MANQHLDPNHSPDWSAIPAPSNDGGADHLFGLKLPSIDLQATSGIEINLSALAGLSVVYIYPMTGRPDVALPDGWDNIPGARGCTPQSCSFRDHFADLRALGVGQVFGLSVQDTDYQKEAVARLHLPFPLLSDADFALADALSLPRMTVEGKVLLKRMALVLRDGTIQKVFYPVFPPDRNAQDVIDWLSAKD